MTDEEYAAEVIYHMRKKQRRYALRSVLLGLAIALIVNVAMRYFL